MTPSPRRWLIVAVVVAFALVGCTGDQTRDSIGTTMSAGKGLTSQI